MKKEKKLPDEKKRQNERQNELMGSDANFNKSLRAMLFFTLVACCPCCAFFSFLFWGVLQEICHQWPAVTSKQVGNRLQQHFYPSLFSPTDIGDERRNLRELLQECK